MSLFSGKKLFLLGFIVILLVAIPLTVYFAQQQQKTKSSAAPATVLSLVESGKTNSTITTTADQTFSLDIIVDPGSNFVNWVGFTLSYDAAKIAIADAGIVANSDAVIVGTGPTYGPSQVSFGLQIGGDQTKVIQVPTKIATITFKAINPTETSPTIIGFSNDTEVLSTSPSDKTGENVLQTKGEAKVTITASGTTTTTIASGTTTTTIASGTTTTTIASGTTTTTLCAVPTQVTNVVITYPYCDNGTCNYTQGKCSWDTLSGATGYNVIVTNIGTSAQVLNLPAFTSVSSGFPVTASATYRCDVSAINACGPGAVGTASLLCDTELVPTVTTTTIAVVTTTTIPATTTALPPTTTTTIAVVPTVVPTGPGDMIMGIGALGAILTIIGAILLFAL